MFDNILNELKRINGMRVDIPLPLDEDGYLDRQCPNPSCQSEFKILSQDWIDKVSDAKVFCPTCRFESPASNWNTSQQIEYAKELAIRQVRRNIHAALTADARNFNRNQQPGFIQMSMSVKPVSELFIVPILAAKIMRQKFLCESCGCNYASIGTAFFCPACGHNSVISTFDQTIETVRQVMALLSSIQITLTSSYNEDVAQNSTRHILEDNLGRLIGAFQYLAEAMFDKLPNAQNFKRRKNIFQNLSESSELWEKATGKGYKHMLSPTELAELECFFQKRHLLAHRNGIVDQEYINKTGDKTYGIGQRLIIQDSDIMRLADLLYSLTQELRKFV